MTKDINKQKKKGLRTNNMTAGAFGAVVGGMVGAGVAVALSDKDRRKLIMQKMEDLRKYVTRTLDEIQSMSEETTDIIEEDVVPKNKTKRIAAKKRTN